MPETTFASLFFERLRAFLIFDRPQPDWPVEAAGAAAPPAAPAPSRPDVEERYLAWRMAGHRADVDASDGCDARGAGGELEEAEVIIIRRDVQGGSWEELGVLANSAGPWHERADTPWSGWWSALPHDAMARASGCLSALTLAAVTGLSLLPSQDAMSRPMLALARPSSPLLAAEAVVESVPLLKVLPTEVRRRSDVAGGQEFARSTDAERVLSDALTRSGPSSSVTATDDGPVLAQAPTAPSPSPARAAPFRPALREPPMPAPVEDGFVEDEGEPMVFDEPAAEPLPRAAQPKPVSDAAVRSKPAGKSRPQAKRSRSRSAAPSPAVLKPHRKPAVVMPARTSHVASAAPPSDCLPDHLVQTSDPAASPCWPWALETDLALCPLFELVPCAQPRRPTSKRKTTRPRPQPYVSVHDIIMSALNRP